MVFVFLKRDFKAAEYTIPELKKEITSQYTEKEILENDIPHHVAIGAFNVNIEDLRKFLIDKRQEAADGLLEMHENSLQIRAHDILNEFNAIWSKLVTEPDSIEEIFEIREWMESLPMNVSSIVDLMLRLKIDYDVLDQFNWNLSDENFNDKWEFLKFPLKIKTQVLQRSRPRETFTFACYQNISYTCTLRRKKRLRVSRFWKKTNFTKSRWRIRAR